MYHGIYHGIVFSFIKNILLFVTILLSLKDIVPNEITQTQSGNTLHDLIYLIFSLRKSSNMQMQNLTLAVMLGKRGMSRST